MNELNRFFTEFDKINNFGSFKSFGKHSSILLKLLLKTKEKPSVLKTGLLLRSELNRLNSAAVSLIRYVLIILVPSEYLPSIEHQLTLMAGELSDKWACKLGTRNPLFGAR